MGFIVKAIKSVVKTVVGVVSKVIGGVFGFLVGGNKSSKKTTSVNTLNKTLDPEAYRKAVLGRVAGPLDQRYWEVWGTNGTKFDEVIVVATHQINAFKELYFEDELGIDAAGAVQGKYVGALTRATRLGAPGQTALPVGAGQYDALATFDGCAAMALSWLPDEKKLPNGIPNRYTQVIEGALVYDPRRDSTVPGGSGTHRITDQTTWAYATLDGNGVPIGRNNALQTLWYLLGWRIPTKDAGGVLTGLSELVFGRGVDPTDINLATFIAGANACEAAGYYTDIALSSENTHTANEAKITCDGLIGQLIDPGGFWSYYANVDDTANVAVTLTDQDVIEGVTVSWNPSHGMSDQYTGVVGKYVNPSATTLFQAFPYPMVRDATYEANLGKKVRKTQDFEQVLDSTLAQRLARLFLNQGQYQGEWSSGFNYRALLAQAWSVVRYTSERHQFDLLFRVWRQDISSENGIAMLLKQIDPSIWTAGTVNAALAPAAGTKYDASQLINAAGVAIALTPMAGAGGTLGDGFTISWTAPPTNVRRTEIRYRLVGTVPWLTDGPVAADVLSLAIGPLFSGAIYEAAVRHISIHEVPGGWISPGGGAFALGTTGNVNYAAIAAAGGTALWSNIVGQPNAPTNNADVTLTHVSSGITGQGPGATALDYEVLNNSLRNSIVNVGLPVGGNYNSPNPSVTGSIKIQLPITINIGVTGYDAMVRFFVDVFEYNTGKLQTYVIAGYLYNGGPQWINVTARLIGGSDAARSVIFTREGGYWCVRIGGVADVWQYPAISVRDIQVSYQTLLVATWASGWVVSLTTAAPGATDYTIANPNPGDAVFGINMLETWNGALATTGNFKTILGIASGFTGQGALSLLSAAAWASNISGRPTELTDGRIAAGIDSSGDLARNLVVSRLNSSNVLRWTGGALYAGELTADTTLSHIASGFTGQTAWATRAGTTVSWSTEIGSRPAELTDGRITAGIDSAGDLVRNITTTRRNASNLLGYTGGATFSGELAADVTNTHIASGFTGQGLLAIRNTARLGTEIVDSAGAVLSEQHVRNAYADGSVTHVFSPVGGTLNVAGTGTGAVRIKLPVGYTDTMIKFTVDIHQYSTGLSSTYIVSGYTYGTGLTWFNVSAQMIGDASQSLPVHFGDSGGKACIWIGSAGTTWQYIHVQVRDLQLSYNNQALSVGWESGWAVALDTGAQTSSGGSVPVVTKPTGGPAILSNNAFRANGTTGIADADAITALGVASGFTGQGSLSLLNNLDPSTSSLTAKGSIPATIPDNSFSYTSTTTTITVTWPNIVVYRVDGTSITISSGSQAITGLSASTSYKIYPYAVDGGGSSGTMSFVTGGSGSPTIAFTSANAAAAASMYGRANIPMGSFIAATPASGSGGGGGGGSTCYHERNPMLTGRGVIEAGQLLVGDVLPSPSGWQAIKELRRQPSSMWVAVTCGEVTDMVVPHHVFYKANGQAVTANELKLGDLLLSQGDHKEVVGLWLNRQVADRILTELAEPHLYYGGALQLLSHNPKP